MWTSRNLEPLWRCCVVIIEINHLRSDRIEKLVKAMKEIGQTNRLPAYTLLKCSFHDGIQKQDTIHILVYHSSDYPFPLRKMNSLVWCHVRNRCAFSVYSNRSGSLKLHCKPPKWSVPLSDVSFHKFLSTAESSLLYILLFDRGKLHPSTPAKLAHLCIQLLRYRANFRLAGNCSRSIRVKEE